MNTLSANLPKKQKCCAERKRCESGDSIMLRVNRSSLLSQLVEFTALLCLSKVCYSEGEQQLNCYEHHSAGEKLPDASDRRVEANQWRWMQCLEEKRKERDSGQVA